MEELTKTQIVLLVILVSFVTSIATGITTVTLMNQAPPAVSQTINRVIQKTIETVTPGNKNDVKTVIVKEEDLIVDAIDKNKKNLLSIKNTEDKSTAGTGFLVSENGLMIGASQNFSDKGDYYVSIGEETMKVKLVKSSDIGFAILQIVIPETSKTKTFEFSNLMDSETLKVGQNVIAINSSNVTIGTFTGFGEIEIGKEKIKTINDNLNLGKSYGGSPVVDTNGNILGVVLPQEEGTITIPSNYIKEAIDSLNKITI